MSNECLFDDFDRKDTGYSNFSESQYDYLNRCGHSVCKNIRNVLEDWFQRYPEDKKSEFISRFTDNDWGFLSSFWELYLYELLLRNEYQVILHPEKGNEGNKPDFLVKKDGEIIFYLEARITTPSEIKKRVDVFKNQILDSINKVYTPNYLYHINFLDILDELPDTKNLVAWVKETINKLNPDEQLRILKEHGIFKLPEFEWEDNGWTLKFIFIPLEREQRGKNGKCIGGFSGPGEMVISRIGLRRAIKKKATKYGDFDVPYIIGVNVCHDHFHSKYDIYNALFGDMVMKLIFNRETGRIVNSEPDRKPNGAFIGPNGPINTRVSGIICAGYINPYNIARNTPILWHNPWAKIPFNEDLLSIPQYLAGKGEYIEKAGFEGYEIFKLSQNWPE